MADQDQLHLIKQGALKWNQWRREHPSVRPELREADLFIANLSRANLSGADLSGTTLRPT